MRGILDEYQAHIDYLPYCPQLYCWFFDRDFGLSNELKLSFDNFNIIEPGIIPKYLKCIDK